LGARVQVSDGKQGQDRRVESAYSYCAANEAVAHFGVGATEVGPLRLDVRWPAGVERRYLSMPPRSVLLLFE